MGFVESSSIQWQNRPAVCPLCGRIFDNHCANSPSPRLAGVVSFQVGDAMAANTFLSLGTFYGDVAVISFAEGGGLGTVLGALYYPGICAGFYSMRIALENEIEFEITGIKTLFHVPSPQPLIFS